MHFFGKKRLWRLTFASNWNIIGISDTPSSHRKRFFMLLTFLFALLSLAVTAAVYFTLWGSASPLWLFAIAVGAFLAFNILYLLFITITSPLLSKDAQKKSSRFAYSVVGATADWVLFMLGFRVRMRGKDKLPKTPFIVISNHRSAMDALVSLRALRGHSLCFISKASVLRWPVVGNYMRRAGHLGIERDMPLQSLRTIKAAAKRIKEDGVSFGIFPEGTRTKTGKVGEFKEGAFLAAKKAECPIVVVTTEGTEHSLRRLSPKATVTVRAVISADEVKQSTPAALCESTHKIITEALGE